MPGSDEQTRADEARITDATLVVYPGAGHTPRWEEPQLFADDLAESPRVL